MCEANLVREPHDAIAHAVHDTRYDEVRVASERGVVDVAWRESVLVRGRVSCYSRAEV